MYKSNKADTFCTFAEAKSPTLKESCTTLLSWGDTERLSENCTLSSEWLWSFAVLIKAKLNFGDQKRTAWTNASVSNTDGRAELEHSAEGALHVICQKYGFQCHWPEIMARCWEVPTISASHMLQGVKCFAAGLTGLPHHDQLCQLLKKTSCKETCLRG